MKINIMTKRVLSDTIRQIGEYGIEKGSANKREDGGQYERVRTYVGACLKLCSHFEM